ncbi:MAG: hypothetical protein H6839_09215 [Planctomycetes bacterium]|nr:hypothetical protein [Planctomycetota bacterium]
MKLHLGTLTRLYTTLLPLEEADEDVVAGAVSAWRHWINKELPHALNWEESPTAPFETVAVGDKAWGALVASVGDQLRLPDLWLPGEHDFLFQVRDLAEREIWVGSSRELLRAVQDLSVDTAGHETVLTLARRSLEFRLPLARLP